MAKIRFTHIAAALAASDPSTILYAGVSDAPYIRETWRRTVNNVADVLAADNPKFDRRRFLTACGVKLSETVSGECPKCSRIGAGPLCRAHRSEQIAQGADR